MVYPLFYLLAVTLMTASCTSPNKSAQPVYNSPSNEQVKIHYLITLTRLEDNPLFKKVDKVFVSERGLHEITVKSTPFENKKAAQTFLLNRRTYLHQAYSTLVAPYYGVVNADPECMKLVNVSGELKKDDESETVELAFVADETGNLTDCYSEKPFSTVKYFLKYCYKAAAVYEVKLKNRIGDAEPALSLSCN